MPDVTYDIYIVDEVNEMKDENERLRRRLAEVVHENAELNAALDRAGTDWRGEGAGPNAEPGLKPCPFCGGDPVIGHNFWEINGERVPYWKVICRKCLCSTRKDESEAAAVDRWNTRAIAVAPGQAAGLLEAVNDVLRYAEDTVWVGDGETLADRMVRLGFYSEEVYEGAEPWEVGA